MRNAIRPLIWLLAYAHARAVGAGRVTATAAALFALWTFDGGRPIGRCLHAGRAVVAQFRRITPEVA